MSNSGRSHRIGTTGNLQQSMRANYGEHGVDKYYKQVGASYRNPHFPGIRACIFTWLERDVGGGLTRSRHLVPDHLSSLTWHAAGKEFLPFPINVTQHAPNHSSGEVTVAAYEWWKRGVLGIQPSRKGMPPQKPDSTQSGGPEGVSLIPTVKQVPDDLLIIAADPYTQAAYAERTTLPCAPLSFREISEGLLPPIASTATSIGTSHANGAQSSIDRIDMVVCSFALHLLESSSELFALLRELSTKAHWLVVLAPHKKPEIKAGWGWVKWDTESWTECGMQERKELLLERVHCRVYRSINVPDPGQEAAERGE